MWLMLQVASKMWKQTCINTKQQSQKHNPKGSEEHNTWSKARKEAQTQSAERKSIKL